MGRVHEHSEGRPHNDHADIEQVQRRYATPRKFRKRPVVVQAVQLRWTQWDAVCALLGGIISSDNPARFAETCSDPCGESPPFIELTIPTLEGSMTVRHGDWLVRGVNGEIYPVKPDIFVATYEPVVRSRTGGSASTSGWLRRLLNKTIHKIL